MRPLRFVRDSLEVLRELPEEVKDEIGFALERVQWGKMPENAKPLKGIAPGAGDCFRLPGRCVQGGLYREVPKAVYVLHVFQKKSKRGIATPRHEMKLVEKRLARSRKSRAGI
jgi:phage-related protein